MSCRFVHFDGRTELPDLPQRLFRLLGAWWDRAYQWFAAPSAGTLRRVLIDLDADELDIRRPGRGCVRTPV